jgi:hypothetical protein
MDFISLASFAHTRMPTPEVDPILWTKNERSFATPMQVCLTRNM